MSLIPFICSVERDTVTLDDYGGETAVSATIYSGLSATFNYLKQTSMRTSRHESFGGGTRSPGVQTKNAGVVFFDPWPNGLEILEDDRIVASGNPTDVPGVLNVIGVRGYENELQLDVEVVKT